jgi:hypothetical protein
MKEPGVKGVLGEEDQVDRADVASEQDGAEADWETGTESMTLPENLLGAGTDSLNIKYEGLRSEGSSSEGRKSETIEHELKGTDGVL